LNAYKGHSLRNYDHVNEKTLLLGITDTPRSNTIFQKKIQPVTGNFGLKQGSLQIYKSLDVKKSRKKVRNNVY